MSRDVLGRLALLVLVVALVAGCSNDPSLSSSASPALTATPEPPQVEETNKPGPRPATTYMPGPSATPAATPTAVPTIGAPGTQTGIAGVDGVISAVLNRDAAALSALMPLQAVPCTNAQGLGGPPSCPETASGYAPEGTLVRSFPYAVCEGEWTEDVLALAERLLEQSPRLYGVIQLRLAAPLFNDPYLQRPDYGVILEVMARFGGEDQPLGIMLQLRGGSVVYVLTLCFGPPEDFLKPGAFFADKYALILRGPAYRDS